jgi:hypothetical protein
VIFKLLTILFSLILDLLSILRVTDNDKDLEIILLRQQIRILQRKVTTTPRITDPERVVLATLVDKYKGANTGARQRLNQVMMIFKPETVLRWHRELVRRKWTYKRKGKPGRPRITAEVEALIVQMAKENDSWGYERIQGELLKLGHMVCPNTVGNILKRQSFPRFIGDGITPACERSVSSWRKFLGHYKEQMLACDFFHCRDHRSQNHLRSVLHRAGDPVRPSDGLHSESQRDLGYSTSSQSDLGTRGGSSRESLSHPGQRQEVLRSFRYGVRFRRYRDCDDPVSGPSGECIRGALGTFGSRRVPRSHFDRERATSAPRSQRVYRVLQPGSSASGHWPTISHFRSGAQHSRANSQTQRAWRYDS